MSKQLLQGCRLVLAILLCGGMLAMNSDRPAWAAAKKSESVVKASASAGKPDADGKVVVTVTLAIEKPWHTYANPVPKDFPGMPTTVTVDGKTKPEDVKIDYPAGKAVKDNIVGDYSVYEDKTEIKVTVKRAKGESGPVSLSVQVQACSDKTKQCLVPSTLKVTAP